MWEQTGVAPATQAARLQPRKELHLPQNLSKTTPNCSREAGQETPFSSVGYRGKAPVLSVYSPPVIVVKESWPQRLHLDPSGSATIKHHNRRKEHSRFENRAERLRPFPDTRDGTPLQRGAARESTGYADQGRHRPKPSIRMALRPLTLAARIH